MNLGPVEEMGVVPVACSSQWSTPRDLLLTMEAPRPRRRSAARGRGAGGRGARWGVVARPVATVEAAAAMGATCSP